MRNYDVIIVGGGIIGATSAFELAKEKMSVCLLESGEIAGGTTAAGMGHIVVMDDSEAQFALTSFSQKLWREMAQSLPPNCEYETCGTIWVATDEEEMDEVFRKNTFYRERGIESEILDEKSLLQAEPNLRQGLFGGLLVKNDSVVYQPTVTNHFLTQAKQLGAVFFTRNQVTEIAENYVKTADGSRVSGGIIINAAGVSADFLTKKLPLKKKKGHLIVTDRYPNFARHQLVELGYLKSAHANESESVAFNIQPRITGQVIIGSSRQLNSNDKDIDYNILRKMTERAFEFMPKLKKLSVIRIWTGFRPATPDNLPYIGRISEKSRVYLATGHEGLGITTSIATAKLLADEIFERPSEIPREAYSPERLGKNYFND